ncbi:MAG: DUF2436 domain-containing protein, partial [Dysgonamonadaceae bacterium]|nr:DUF2436 domain-containing protein [Dysgonamonadaceae bacterium]
MKNLVTLFIVLSVCATVKGQIRMRVNGNNDGNDSARVILKVSEGLSGYQMLLDADANTYNTVGAPVFILSYRHFEYKIPVNADRNPSTNNKIVNGSGGVNIPAGVYDYFITKPSPNSNPLLNRIECESGSYSATRGHNFVFEAGKTYLFTVFPDGFVICDIRPADVPSEPSGLTVTSSTSGASKCTLNWKNPDSTAGENPLPDLTSVTILRDSKVVDLISGTSPGVNVAWTDENPVKKEHTYSVYAKNNAGAGFSISKMVAMDTVIFHPAVNKDAAIIAITNPVNGMNLSDTETVTVIVKNKGLQAISNIPLSFDIDGQPVGSGICTASIPAGGEVAFPFSQKANLSDARSSYIIKARTVLNGDENPDNDVFITQIDNYGDCHIDAPCFLGFEDDMEFNCWSSYNDSENSYWKRINKLTSAEPVRSGQSA